MSTIVRMTQGSPEWHDHRHRYRNASETPAVLGVSPWRTPYQLWQLKLGLIEEQVTPAMQRGTEFEPVARAVYERQTGRVMQPLIVVDGEYSASLDGMTLGGERIVEIKCPVRARKRFPVRWRTEGWDLVSRSGATLGKNAVDCGPESPDAAVRGAEIPPCSSLSAGNSNLSHEGE
jgi:putative phage-type endonuclease